MSAGHTPGPVLDSNGMKVPEPKSRTIEEAVADCYAGYVARAAKRGRNPRFPYVPVIEFPSGRYGAATTQIRGMAFERREQAIECAQRQIDRYRSTFATQLAEPRMRAIRAQWGVPDSACSDPDAAERLNRLFGREVIAKATGAA